MSQVVVSTYKTIVLRKKLELLGNFACDPAREVKAVEITEGPETLPDKLRSRIQAGFTSTKPSDTKLLLLNSLSSGR